MIRFNKKRLSVLNYRMILNENHFFIFFSINALNARTIDKLKSFLLLNKLEILNSDIINLFSLSCINLYFLRRNFLCCCCKDLNFLTKIVEFDILFENIDCLFLFYEKFLNLYNIKDLIIYLNKFNLSYVLFFFHVSICFFFFHLKLFIWIKFHIDKINIIF